MDIEIKKLTVQPFSIHDFIVDVKRGTISQKDQITAIEPKVMQVLLYLVVHAENVVEQHELFGYVWPRSVFSPTSLRRCIATLRKAFSDTDKALISTHPKIGYSINAIPCMMPTFKHNTRKRLSINRASIALLIISVLISLIFSQLLIKESVPKINNMFPITASEILEDFIAISPNGNRLAFIRYADKQIKLGKLWLKNIDAQQEYELPLPAAYRRNVNWSRDGQSIIYVEVLDTGWAIYQLAVNNFSVSDPILLFSMPNSSWISSVHLDLQNNLYFLAKNNHQLNLYKYANQTKQLTSLLSSSSKFNLYEIDLSNDSNQLAISGKNDLGETFLKVMRLDKKPLLPLVETLSFRLNQHQQYSVKWLAKDAGWLLNNGRQLFYLSLSGKLTKLDFEHNQFIRFAQQSGDGREIFLVSEKLDNDFWLYDLGKSNETKIIDSNAMDYFPSISPNDKKVAYYSTRYGKPQLFLYDINSKSDRLIFANPDNYLNVSKVYWGQSSEQLTFSIGDQIYFSKLFEGQLFTQKIDGLLGRPIGLYKDEQSILIHQKKQNTSRLIKWNIKDATEQFVVDIEQGTAYLNFEQEVILVNSKVILKLSINGEFEEICNFPKNINRMVANTAGIYIQFEDDTKYWQFWSFKQQELSSSINNIPQEVVGFSHSKRFILTNEMQKQQDILKLEIE